MDRSQTRTDNQIVIPRRDSRGMEMIRARVAQVETETEDRADSQVRAAREKTTPITISQELTRTAPITTNQSLTRTAVSPTLDDFGNTGTTINTNVNAANMEQHHALSKALSGTDELHRYIVIPAYQPDERLVTLVRALHRESRNPLEIVVIDDGSDASCKPVFEALGGDALVLPHLVNQGKGAALKTAFSYIRAQRTRGVVVTADADGQHTPEDILRVGYYVEEHPEKMALGKRTFKGNIPWRSRVGNRLTQKLFAWCSGHKIQDTQTGLRGFATEYMPFLQNISGDRYEYEMNMLYEWVRTYYVADVELSSAEYLKTALAQNMFGTNVTETTSEQAEDHNAILAINGDYYGANKSGYVIKNGTVYRSSCMAVCGNGNGRF